MINSVPFIVSPVHGSCHEISRRTEGLQRDKPAMAGDTIKRTPCILPDAPLKIQEGQREYDINTSQTNWAYFAGCTTQNTRRATWIWHQHFTNQLGLWSRKHFYMGHKTGLWQPYRDEELKLQKWSYWDLWQATPFMTTKQTTPYAVNCRLNAYWTG